MNPSIVIKVTQPIKELNGQVGLIACDKALADRLVKGGLAEYRHPEAEYETKVMTAKKPKKAKG